VLTGELLCTRNNLLHGLRLLAAERVGGNMAYAAPSPDIGRQWHQNKHGVAATMGAWRQRHHQRNQQRSAHSRLRDIVSMCRSACFDIAKTARRRLTCGGMAAATKTAWR
jgi:putative NADPH-quinone reductase